MQKIVFLFITVTAALYTSAQTPVRNEPRHHNVFENNYVRILDVHFPPKDTTQYHLHNTPSVFTTFTKTLTGSQLKDNEPQASNYSVAGEIWYDSLVTPRLHRVWNDDSTWFHVMDVELTAGLPSSKQEVLTSSFLQLLYNKPLVNVYRLLLKKGESIQLPATTTGYLLISLGEAIIHLSTKQQIEKRIMKGGHYHWIPAGNTVLISLTSEGMSGFSLLQLK